MTWLSPVLIVVTAGLLGRAHYGIYVLKKRNTFSMAITWASTVFVVGYWSWQWVFSNWF